MISLQELIADAEAGVESLLGFILQIAYLVYLLMGCLVLIALICAPFLVGYVIYMGRKEAKAKRRAPSDPANAADAEQVKGRAPGSSDHASPIRRTEARAERTLEHPPP